jgi:hypothetical protein
VFAAKFNTVVRSRRSTAHEKHFRTAGSVDTSHSGILTSPPVLSPQSPGSRLKLRGPRPPPTERSPLVARGE